MQPGKASRDHDAHRSGETAPVFLGGNLRGGGGCNRTLGAVAVATARLGERQAAG